MTRSQDGAFVDDPPPLEIRARNRELAAVDPGALVVAFFLTQLHQTAENEERSRTGFLDWVTVRRAKALFEGHNQPRVPGALGYYDLLDIEPHHAQAQLAKASGVGAFCYYAHWFQGRRLLEGPLELVGAHPELAMPYAICWENEPWSGQRNHSEHKVQVAPRRAPDGDAQFIDDMAHHLADPRYLRVLGRPLLLLSRPALLEEPIRTTDALRERAHRLGIGDLFLAMVQSFGHWEPISYGFDAAVEFPPHGLEVAASEARPRRAPPAGRARGAVSSYLDAIRVALSRPVPQFTWFRGLIPDWDDTPRRGPLGSVYRGASPTAFRGWLDALIECTYLFRPPGERLIFVNAWNGWAEGAYLEPDTVHGGAFLQAIRAALDDARGLADETAKLGLRAPGDSRLLEIARARWTGYPALSATSDADR